MTDTTRLTSTFEAHRDWLFGLAYRMLGSRADADDVLQNVWIRWSEHGSDVEHPTAWLRTVTTRAALDETKRAYRRREEYVGPWLPEPLYDETSVATALSPAQSGAEERLVAMESLSLRFLQLCELLSPSERAAYLLRTVYGVAYGELATTLERSEAACRKLVSRARARLEEASASPESEHATRETKSDEETVQSFLMAVLSGDDATARVLLLEGVVATTDSDGKKSAARRPLIGSDRVLAFITGLARMFDGSVRTEPFSTNGRPGLRIYVGDALETVAVFETRAGRVSEVFLYRNPAKFPSNSQT